MAQAGQGGLPAAMRNRQPSIPGVVEERCVQFEARPRGLVDGTQVTLPA